MKTAQQLKESLPERLRNILEFDLREIDNPDPRHHARLNYLDRLNKILSIFERRFPRPAGKTVADIGCGQGNLSLLLAERGFDVTAVDIGQDFLDYASLKQEGGSVRWLKGGFDEAGLEKGRFDAVMLGEIIEHCAYPEDLIAKALGYLKTGGWLVLTTPNAEMFRNHLPTFGQLRRREDRKFLESRQFGPDGADHLFLFTRSDLRLLLPPQAVLEETGYLGGSVLLNRWTTFLLRPFPAGLGPALERLAAVLPWVNRRFSHGLYAVAVKA